MSTAVLVPSAQYLRRSTEYQQYSLDKQQAAIACFASQHGFSVVQTYADARTRVVLGRRSGFRQLLQDVISGNATYKAILVYDVSRWGRFQDNDEGAHYEFVCKSAGFRVHSCAESFSRRQYVKFNYESTETKHGGRVQQGTPGESVGWAKRRHVFRRTPRLSTPKVNKPTSEWW